MPENSIKDPTEYISEFEKIVKEMRDYQKQYFKTRDRNILELSKAAERRVDQYLQNKLTPKLF